MNRNAVKDFWKRERTAFLATDGTQIKHGFVSRKWLSDPCSIRVSSVAKIVLGCGSAKMRSSAPRR